MLANGDIVSASPHENSELFYSVIGGYGGIGIIIEVQFELADNKKIERIDVKMDVADYKQFFFENVRQNPKAIFHNADLYPPHYTKCRSITWYETDKELTCTKRVVDPKASYSLERYFIWSIMTTFSGKWRRENLIDPLLYLSPKIV